MILYRFERLINKKRFARIGNKTLFICKSSYFCINFLFCYSCLTLLQISCFRLHDICYGCGHFAAVETDIDFVTAEHSKHF